MHDINDIEKDIFKVEGLVIDISSYTPANKFVTKYSEHYGKQLNSNESKLDLEERITQYLDNDQEIKDQLLETIIKDLIIQKRKYSLLDIMGKPIFTSILTTVIMVVIYFLFIK